VARPRVLILGGSEPLGYAGLHADLRHAQALGAEAVGVPTALTEQSRDSVLAWHPMPRGHVQSLLRLARADASIGAVKIGQVPDPGTALEIQDGLRGLGVPIVLDPVLQATAGPRLSDPEAMRVLLPQAALITPNLPELRILAEAPAAAEEDELVAAGRRLLAAGARAVLVKGGHTEPEAPLRDLLVTPACVRGFEGVRSPGTVRGTGCALATAVAVFLAAGSGLESAVAAALLRVRAAICAALLRGRARLDL
jgi:hydroxymethylpyrimidine/phosphomethylpyrimidine kinase